ncbi:MAG: hypothetical protein P1V13_01950 [Rhizobiaceae bacterium]|nr:hypothetical protein [Rhizobiaceae bacterium]
MTEFNRLTIVAAIETIADYSTHDDMKVFEVQWDLEQYGILASSKSARVSSWATVATKFNPKVWTEAGQVNLDRALVELASQAPDIMRSKAIWRKFLAGLRFDGFEIAEELIPDPNGRQSLFDNGPSMVKVHCLRRMLPENVPGTDFREAENELETLLTRHGLGVALGHLKQAVGAFQRGDWAASNGQLRTFFESYLNDIAVKLGYAGADDTKSKRDFLAQTDPPFLLMDVNEWNTNAQKPQYIRGLWSRLHSKGSHPGLSEEDDATFRLQITLVTARLFLRRFDQRK